MIVKAGLAGDEMSGTVQRDFPQELVLHEHILTEVRGSAQAKNVKARANEVWENTCYRLDLYTVGGKTLAKGDAFLAWCQRG